MQDNRFTLTFPFSHKPDIPGLPEWAQSWGYDGVSGGRTFGAAGVTLTFRINTLNIAEVGLSNLTTRGAPAKHEVAMPPAVMDQMALTWLIQRGLVWRRIIAMGLMGFEVTTWQPYTTQDGVVIPERTKGKVVAQLTPTNQAIVLFWVEFGEETATISAEELLDRDKFDLSFSF